MSRPGEAKRTKMKITIFTIGSRGDVEPMVAFGEGLQDSGHTVTIVTEGRFESFVRGHGLGYVRVPGDTQGLLGSEEMQQILSRKNNSEAFFKCLMNATLPVAKEIFDGAMEACRDTDHIITTSVTIYVSYFIAHQLSRPITLAFSNPIVASSTKYFHNQFLPPPATWLPDAVQQKYNKFSHDIIPDAMWKTYIKSFGKVWKQMSTAPLPKEDPLSLALKLSPPLRLYGYSPALLPKPEDWDDTQHVTGYWNLKADRNYKPPVELESFLHAGPAPIYIGFGSMNNSLLKNGALEKLLVDLAHKTKQRIVVLKQGLNTDAMQLPSTVFATDPLPFSYLFPRMSLLVHHGGAGTTGVGLQAGVPAVVTPLIVDQSFWGWRMHQIGVGAEPIEWHKLNADNLSAAITKTLADNSIKTKVKALGTKVAAEDGVKTAVEIFNKKYS
jgi:UDP:flavonoid glycosyltransferase YjiC (YdhE family)